ncbi:fungal hydrophobin-domain-containing protein [Trametes gibbosa]|nr:fungal hydrophobin-domain-containing protein [Trametes gibbosa]
MVFFPAATLAIAISPLLAAATPLEARQTCSTGAIQCCQQTTSAASASGAALLGLLGIVVQDANVLLGVDCSPISVVGVGNSGACSANTVCCEDSSHGGLVSIGCLPISL